MTTKTQTEKAAEMADELKAARDAGESLASISRRTGLRREVVSMTLGEGGSEQRAAVLKFVRENPGLSVDDITLRLGLGKNTVSRYLRGTEEHDLLVSRKTSPKVQYSDTQMFEALRTAWRKLDADGRANGLSRTKYERLMTDEDIAPSPSAYVRRYRSWSAACALAGITASAARRASYSRSFTDDDILDAISDYEAETGETSYHKYCDWARANGRPSGPSIIVRMSAWSTARRSAMEKRLTAAA
jgi:DNA-binding transcriptional ArsR family regulator